jgi:hypothetical protein
MFIADKQDLIIHLKEHFKNSFPNVFTEAPSGNHIYETVAETLLDEGITELDGDSWCEIYCGDKYPAIDDAKRSVQDFLETMELDGLLSITLQDGTIVLKN